MKRVQFIT